MTPGFPEGGEATLVSRVVARGFDAEVINPGPRPMIGGAVHG
jgi:hypothetical protein